MIGEFGAWFALAAAAGTLLWHALTPEPQTPVEQDGLEALGRAVEKARKFNEST